MTRLLSLFLLVSIAGRAAAEKPAPTPPTFESHIRPLFKIYCLDCHGEGEELRDGRAEL